MVRSTDCPDITVDVDWDVKNQTKQSIKHTFCDLSCIIFREVLRDQAEGYVRGIQWILRYYYEGVPSWSWYVKYYIFISLDKHNF